MATTSPRFDTTDSPFLREIMEAFADEEVNEISIMCSAQSGKTVLMLVLMAWVVCEDPGSLLWVTATTVEARKFAKSRLNIFFDQCAPIVERMPTGRSERTTLETYFPGAPVVITGSNSESALQSTPYRYIFLDEVRSYPKGALDMVSKRTRSYTYNYKKVVISTPDQERDDIHNAFMKGDQCHWESKCPECGEYHELRWGEEGGGEPDLPGGVKFDLNDETMPAPGRYNMEALLESVRYECPDCGHAFTDHETDRKAQAKEGRWVKRNPGAATKLRSFHWNALLPWWSSLKTQVEEYITATIARQYGDYHPYKDHINETRGLPWSDRMRFGDSDDFLTARQGKYDVRADWELEERRFAAVDVQGKGGRHYYVLIRAWGKGAKSRLLHWQVVFSIEELIDVLKEWKVKGDNVVIDSGAWATEVYQNVADSGYRWKAMKGEDKEFFMIKSIRMLTNTTRVDPAIGTGSEGRVRLIGLRLYAKYGCLDRLTNLMHGVFGEWQLPPEIPESEKYMAQVCAYDRREEQVRSRGEETKLVWYRRSKEDHLASCEIMQIAAASAVGLLMAPEDAPPPPAKEQTEEMALEG